MTILTQLDNLVMSNVTLKDTKSNERTGRLEYFHTMMLIRWEENSIIHRASFNIDDVLEVNENIIKAKEINL